MGIKGEWNMGGTKGVHMEYLGVFTKAYGLYSDRDVLLKTKLSRKIEQYLSRVLSKNTCHNSNKDS